jgi:hypothetical protein
MNILSRIVPLLTGAVVMLFSFNAEAWHAAGHMMVAAVAWEQMTPAARARATELLKLNPDYDKWIAGVPDADKDKTAFVHAAIWPDEIKNHTTHPDSIDDTETPSDPNAAANLGYTDKLMHKYWHYIDLPFSSDKTRLMPAKTVNAETQIGLLTSAIASTTASENVKSFDVTWLIHLVGDVHQPLHATSHFSKVFKQGDDGGNKVTVHCTPSCGSNLHTAWDGLVDENKTPADAILAAATLANAPAGPASQSDPHIWINESFAIAKASVYRSPVGPGKGSFTLTTGYMTAAKKIAQTRIALAGARLAKLFNTSLK